MANSAPQTKKRRLGYTVAAMLAASLAASVVVGSPDPLPAAAMGSDVVLHAERTAAVFVLLFLALLVLVRAFQGRLPEELSGRGLKYAERDAVDGVRSELLSSMKEIQAAQAATTAAIADLRERVEAIERG